MNIDTGWKLGLDYLNRPPLCRIYLYNNNNIKQLEDAVLHNYSMHGLAISRL